jgi:hypothetical protein
MQKIESTEINVDGIIGAYEKQIDDFQKLNGHYEQISTLLITHLYVEYFINFLIKRYFKLSAKILDDHNRYTFSVKLDLIYEKDFIPEWLYFNIRKLNKIRNEFSHNLDFDVLRADLILKRDDDNNEIETVDLKNELIGETDEQKRNNLIILQIPTLTLFILGGYIKRKIIGA